ncbi:hypothetical protein KIW74_gp06 [Mycobacterium phage Kimona]|uniref:Uncharacterized protein n=1 Tax=Mycobacterium phage Kimona TaxID=2024295 RepID=A0A249XUD5_9CAUD|nr:hypothetical protein KIW74_gp06 [Mycobacterium phage Kimona]ASZ75522.1 hypothetical protein PBI_KIMONA_86 [Mycobacterium phage Kimona]
MSETIGLLLVGASLFGLGAAVGGAIEHRDPFSQRDFVCQEDEVLGYAPQFGPDRVGCIHVEDITR